MFDDPIGYFLTWVTYGTWLPGDPRGWVEYHRGWQLPDPIKEIEAAARMSEDACRLGDEERAVVENQIRQTCRHRGWRLHAVNCRSNHVHVVMSAADTRPKKVRTDLKAWTTRSLKSRNPHRDNWWAERGSIRLLLDDDNLADAIQYVTEAQDRKPEA